MHFCVNSLATKTSRYDEAFRCFNPPPPFLFQSHFSLRSYVGVNSDCGNWWEGEVEGEGEGEIPIYACRESLLHPRNEATTTSIRRARATLVVKN